MFSNVVSAWLKLMFASLTASIFRGSENTCEKHVEIRQILIYYSERCESMKQDM